MMPVVAAVSRLPGPTLALETLALPEPGPDEVLVRVVATGICHTDLASHQGLHATVHPAVLGHEGAGTVVAIGPGVTSLQPGDRVVMSFGFCGVCRQCRRNEPAYCQHFVAINLAGLRDGQRLGYLGAHAAVMRGYFDQSSFASHALCAARSVVKVEDDGVPLELLGPLGCGVQTGAGAVFEALRVAAGDSLVVMGAGPVGLSAVMAARHLRAAPIVVVEPVAARRALALELGAAVAVDPVAGAVLEQVRACLPAGADHVLDTSGLPAVVEQGAALLGIRGRLGLVGLPPADPMVALNLRHLLGGGRRVQGIVEGDARPQDLIPRLIALYRAGEFPFDRMIRLYPASRIEEAFEDMRQGRVVKPVIRF